MKTTNLFRKILSAGLLLSLMIVVVMSCRKKDDTPQPDPIPLGPVQKDVFTDPKVKMMSDYEVSHNR
ncbi:MAG: hypothetical protein WCI71_13815, partial [Bacteroidota bacterium]